MSEQRLHVLCPECDSTQMHVLESGVLLQPNGRYVEVWPRAVTVDCQSCRARLSANVFHQCGEAKPTALILDGVKKL